MYTFDKITDIHFAENKHKGLTTTIISHYGFIIVMAVQLS